MISRRGLLTTAATTATAVGLGVSFPPSRASAAVPHAWVGAGNFLHVYDPARPGGPAEYINDHCLIRADDGTWHLFGITGDMAPPGQGPDSGTEHDFAHATAPSLTGPWTRQEHALHVDPDYYGEEHLWAPHVVEHGGKYHMFYAAGGADGAAVNLATSTDLKTWTRLPSGPLFRGIVARDPFVVRVGEQWVMYYCELAGPGGNHIVAARTSTDLTRWSEPFTVFTDPATEADSGPVTESPYVVRREGWWYLFIGPRGGYEGTDVYASTDPMRFTPERYAGHLPAHAPEVVSDGGREWATNCGWFERGVHLAPLNWRTTPPIWHTRANPAAVLGADGRLAVFALDPAGDGMIRRVQTEPGGDAWGDWEPFATACATTPTFGVDEYGRLEVFVLGKDGAGIARRVQKKDGSWGEWTEFAAAACAAPAVARNGDGCLEAFVIGPSRELAHRRQTSPGGEWSGWQRFGTAAGGPPAVCADPEGRLTVLAVGPSREHIARRFQTVPGGGWSEWDGAFGPTPCGDVPTVALDVTGRLEVQALVPYGGAVARRRQNAPGGEWGDWEGEFLGWSSTSPTVIANRDGRLESFAVSPGGGLMTRRFQTSASGGWSAREDFGGGPCMANPSAARDAAGRIHLFAVSPGGNVSTRAQTAPDGEWGDWQPFGTERIAALPAGQAT